MNDPIQLTVRTIANGATAQLRSILDVADRDEARRLRTELLRLATTLAFKHGFETKPAEMASLLKERTA